MPLSIRDFRDSDTETTARLFFDAVREGAAPFYDEAQRAAWAPDVPSPDSCREKLNHATTLVAEDDKGLAGFMSLEDNGHIDMAFVRPDLRGTGAAARLYDEIIAVARDRGFSKLTVDASHLARRFFEKRGWTTVREQKHDKKTAVLVNFRMETML